MPSALRIEGRSACRWRGPIASATLCGGERELPSGAKVNWAMVHKPLPEAVRVGRAGLGEAAVAEGLGASRSGWPARAAGGKGRSARAAGSSSGGDDADGRAQDGAGGKIASTWRRRRGRPPRTSSGVIAWQRPRKRRGPSRSVRSGASANSRSSALAGQRLATRVDHGRAAILHRHGESRGDEAAVDVVPDRQEVVLGEVAAEQAIERCANAAEGEVAFGDMVKHEEVIYQAGIFIRGRTVGGVFPVDQPAAMRRAWPVYSDVPSGLPFDARLSAVAGFPPACRQLLQRPGHDAWQGKSGSFERRILLTGGGGGARRISATREKARDLHPSRRYLTETSHDRFMATHAGRRRPRDCHCHCGTDRGGPVVQHVRTGLASAASAAAQRLLPDAAESHGQCAGRECGDGECACRRDIDGGRFGEVPARWRARALMVRRVLRAARASSSAAVAGTIRTPAYRRARSAISRSMAATRRSWSRKRLRARKKSASTRSWKSCGRGRFRRSASTIATRRIRPRASMARCRSMRGNPARSIAAWRARTCR